MLERIPPELVLHFFTCALPTRDCPLSLVDFNAHEAVQKQLCLISKPIKNIAYATPALWSFICLDPGATFNQTTRLLARAKSHPLDIQIFLDDPDSEIPRLRTSLDAILAKAQQWRTVSFTVIGPGLTLEKLHTIIPASLPNLIEMETDTILHADTPFTPYVSAPLLRKLSIGGEGRAAFTLAEMHAVVECSITEFSQDTYQTQWHELMDELAAKCPALETLVVKKASCGTEFDEDDDESDDEASAWPTFQSLKTLHFDGCDILTLKHILEEMNAPRLQEVIVSRAPRCAGRKSWGRHNFLINKVTFNNARLSAIRSFIDALVSENTEVTIDVESTIIASTLRPQFCGFECRQKYGIRSDAEGAESQATIMEHWDWISKYVVVTWLYPGDFEDSWMEPNSRILFTMHYYAYCYMMANQGTWKPPTLDQTAYWVTLPQV